jgi:predicted GNAT superfamily acetyltransferase
MCRGIGMAITIRYTKGEDFYETSPLINEWWGGRQMSDMLPKLFFDHFKNTSFIAEVDGEIVGFLIGFTSQSFLNEAYIHFVGVHPEKRNLQVGRQLYEKFFSEVKKNGRHIVRCVTSPVNKTSISFHTKMGFLIEKGDKVINGIEVHSDYDGKGHDRVLFVKNLS